MDLLLAAGFFATGVGTFAFAVAPVLSGNEAGLGSVETWAARRREPVRRGAHRGRTVRLPEDRQGASARSSSRSCSSWSRSSGSGPTCTSSGWRSMPRGRPGFARRPSSAPTACWPFSRSSRPSASACAIRRHGRDLDSWLALALTLVVFADLHYVLAPLRTSDYVLPSDLLRLLAFGVLLAGVSRAIGQRRVRPGRRRGAGARRARHPRRARAVPLRDLGADQHARVGRRARRRSCPGSSSRRPRRSRRRSSRCSRSRRRRARLHSTRRSGATSTSSSPTASSTSRWRSTRT